MCIIPKLFYKSVIIVIKLVDTNNISTAIDDYYGGMWKGASRSVIVGA